MRYYSTRERGDPSEVQQMFTSVQVKLWCCRFWQLHTWNCNEMSFPYWRIYWNKNPGGVIGFNHSEYVMQSHQLYIIPPNTPFYSYIKGKRRQTTGIQVEGKRIDAGDREDKLWTKALLHLFIHFNLGIPFDRVEPNIYPIELNRHQLNMLEWLTQQLILEPARFSIPVNLHLQSLLFDFLSHLKNELWLTTQIDYRIMTAIRAIDKNLQLNPTNGELARMVHMAKNSFARLFKSEMGMTIQHYIKEQKIDKACALLDHTEHSIESVAQKTGFADRYHFSRIFKNIKGVSPGRYRKG